MRELLDELVDNRRTGKGEGGLYIRKWSRWDRTAEALARRGLAYVDQPDHSPHGKDHWIATEAGLAWVEFMALLERQQAPGHATERAQSDR